MGNRPEIIDNFVYRAQASPPEELEELMEFLADHKQLGHILYSLDYVKKHDIKSFTYTVSELANYISRALLMRCCNDEKIDILKMGKWGGDELGLHSDLDFMFVYNSNSIPPEINKGIRKFLNLIQSNYRAGNLYKIDMRLRPSGNAGPTLVSKSRLQEYIATKAKPWERQAYLKASFLNSPNDDLRDKVLEKSLSQDDYKELSEIRGKLLTKLWDQSQTIDLKYSIGALLDIELQAQEAILKLKMKPRGHSNFDLLQFLAERDAKWDPVLSFYHDLRSIEQALPIFRQRGDAKISIEQYELNQKVFRFSTNVDSFEKLRENLIRTHKYLLNISEPSS